MTRCYLDKQYKNCKPQVVTHNTIPLKIYTNGNRYTYHNEWAGNFVFVVSDTVVRHFCINDIRKGFNQLFTPIRFIEKSFIFQGNCYISQHLKIVHVQRYYLYCNNQRFDCENELFTFEKSSALVMVSIIRFVNSDMIFAIPLQWNLDSFWLHKNTFQSTQPSYAICMNIVKVLCPYCLKFTAVVKLSKQYIKILERRKRNRVVRGVRGAKRGESHLLMLTLVFWIHLMHPFTEYFIVRFKNSICNRKCYLMHHLTD